jgi:RNA polymerase sigma factor (TIGR02999 family)
MLLTQQVYDELRRIAAANVAREAPGLSVGASDLVQEAFLRLQNSFENRGHFFAAAAEAMRRVLVDQARRRNAAKRGGGAVRIDADLDQLEAHVESPHSDADLLAVDGALDAFAVEEPDAAKVVHLHYFCDMSIQQAADALGVSRASAYRHWTYARAWLRDRLSSDNEVT